MCFLIDVALNFKLLTALICVALVFTTHQQMEIFEKEIKDIAAKLDNQHIGSLIKNLKRALGRLKEELQEVQEKAAQVGNEFRLYKHDKTGLADYAYGGSVVLTRETETYESEGLSFLGMPLCGQSRLERRIIENSAMPGDCWPMKGREGSVQIDLIDEVNVQKVTMEHVSRRLLPGGSASSAPREFSLWGVLENGNGNGNSSPHFFGKFTFFAESSEVQTFSVTNPSDKYFKSVELHIHSNHGNPDFTCVYRVRIHGKPKN